MGSWLSNPRLFMAATILDRQSFKTARRLSKVMIKQQLMIMSQKTYACDYRINLAMHFWEDAMMGPAVDLHVFPLAYKVRWNALYYFIYLQIL